MSPAGAIAPTTNLKDDFVICRTLLHSWDEIPDDGGRLKEYRTNKTTARMLFRCTRCGTCRYEVWNILTGDLVSRSYDYVEDYQADPGSGWTQRKIFRQEWAKRWDPLNPVAD
jgi:hypothetical protein